MLWKLGSIVFSPPPDSFLVEGEQQIAQIPIPNAEAVLQNFGGMPHKFTLSGLIFKSAGGLAQALQFDALRTANGPAGPVWLLQVGDLSWQVQILRTPLEMQRGEHVRYTIEMVRSAPEPDFVAVVIPDLSTAYMDAIVAACIAKAKAFNLRGAIAKIYQLLDQVDQYLADIRSFVQDVRHLADLPVNLVNRLAFELSQVLVTIAITQAQCQAILNTPNRTWTAVEDAAGFIYQQLQLMQESAGALKARAQAMPPVKTVVQLKVGQTLQHLAKEQYGDFERWTDIAAANHVPDPSNVAAGTALIIPQ